MSSSSDFSSSCYDINSCQVSSGHDRRIIKAICRNCCSEKCRCKPKRGRYNDDNASFTAMIIPMNDLTTANNQCNGAVHFLMRRKNHVVTLQWEPFSGTIAASGISYLKVNQSICGLPPYSTSVPIYIIYKGIGRITHMGIDPCPDNGTTNLKIYLNTDGSSTGVVTGDAVEIPGGCVTWVTNC